MTEPLNSAQITERARNVAQVIVGFVSTDTDGGETIHSDDLALALRECADTGLLPSGADGVLVWETARALIPASVAVEGLSPEDHPAVRAAIIAFNPDADAFPGEDFPEPADGEGARVAREEAAWEAQIKAAPMPAPASAPTEWSPRAPVGSVWRFADDGLHSPAVAMGLDRLSSNPRGIFGVVREHVACAAYGETFVHADCVLLAFPSGPGVVMPINALVWAAKRVDA
jgi:hypothetical protein